MLVLSSTVFMPVIVLPVIVFFKSLVKSLIMILSVVATLIIVSGG